MKTKVSIILFMITFTIVSCQPDKDFNAVITFNKGFRFSTTGTIYTSLPTSGIADFNTLLNKPLTFPSTWANVSGKPLVFNPDLTVTNPLYKSITYKPSWDEITDKPGSIQLADAILSMQGIRLPVLTTVQINALSPVIGTLVYDSSLNVLKIWTGTWKIVITAD